MKSRKRNTVRRPAGARGPGPELSEHLKWLREEVRAAKKEISAKESYISLVEETSNGLRRAYRELQTVYELSRKLGAIRDSDRLAELLFDTVGEVLPYVAGAYLAYDGLNSTFYLAKERNLTDAIRSEIRSHHGFGYLMWVFREGRPVVLPDAICDGQRSLSVLLVPLAAAPASGEAAAPFGMLQFFVDQRPEDFTQRDFDVLTIAANQAAAAIQNANMYKVVELRAEAVARMKDYLTSILESMTNGLMSLELDGRVALCNVAMENMLGVPVNELLGSTVDSVLEPAVADQISKLFRDALAGVASSEAEIAIPQQRGEPLSLGATATLLKGENSELRGVLILFRDLSETKELINRRKVDQMKDNFISTISHEIRTPITAIKSFSEILMNYSDEDESTRREFVSIINSESDRLTRLVDNILDLSKMESGLARWDLEPLDMTGLLQMAIDSIQSLSISKKQELLFEDLGPFPAVYADRDKLMQVVINLLSNANKFTPEGGVIRLTVDRLSPEKHNLTREFLRVGVHDTGRGIAKENLETAFEKFRQLTNDVLTEKPQGTGLGLPISREIIRRLGGEIWVESDGEHGSSFYFTVPVFHELELYSPTDLEDNAVTVVSAALRVPSVATKHDV